LHPKVGADLGAGGEDVVQAEVGVSDRGAVLCGSLLLLRDGRGGLELGGDLGWDVDGVWGGGHGGYVLGLFGGGLGELG